VSIALQGVIPAIGVRYDHFFTEKLGSYGLYTHGYKNLPMGGKIGNINKYSLGYVRFLPQKINNEVFNTICAGINYQTYNDIYMPNPDLINQAVFNHISFDLGIGGGFNNFSASFTYDIIKSEGGIYFGFKFN
jgi:hypothetical protein